MHTPKPLQAVHTPRRVLSDISNGVSARHTLQYANRDDTLIRDSESFRCNPNGKRGTFGSEVFVTLQQPSKAHGNLSNIRPKSPPLYNLSAALGRFQSDNQFAEGLCLPYDDRGDDSYSLNWEGYNRAEHGDCFLQHIPELSRPSSPLPSESCLMPQHEHEPTKRGSFRYARTPKYALGSPLVPSRLRKRHDHHFEISSDQPRIDIGGISHGHSSVLDLYMPVLRTYPTENGRGAGSDVTLKYLQTCPPVEHIDVCTTWKGMSFAEAELLFQFHQVFKPSMEDLLADQLREQDQTFRRRHAKGTASKDRYSGTAKLSSRFSFNRTRLIESMLLRLQTSQEYMMHPPNRGFRRLLQLYLASCDCLVDIERTGSQNTAIDLLFQYPRPLLPEMPHELHVEAGWSPDFLTFQDLAIVPREGQELRIVPRYNSNAIFRTDGYHTDLRYSLETPLPWLTWDDEVQGFTGFVPPYSDVWGTDSQYGKVYRSGRVGPHAVVNQLRIEIKAQFTECFLPSLCLQRIVRTRLTFRVIPWWAVTNANAPDDQSVRPITPDTAQRYVDNLFDGGLSEEIDLRRTPAAQLQVRRVTGLSSPLDKDDLFSIRLNSQTPSFPSFTSRVDDEMDSISDLHSEKEETISSEESIISDKTTMQSASKTFVDMAIQIPRSYTKKDPLKSLQLAAEDRTRSSQSMASNLTIFTEGLGPDEDNLVLPGKPTESLPITFHNRYSLLHGLKENMYSNSNESDHDSVSCESAISSSETLPLDVHADKAINCRKQPEIRTTFQIGSWTGTLFRNSHGVAFPVQKDGLLLSEDNMSITSGTENSFGSGDHALEAMSNFGF